jgi:hypothetical protein
MHLPPGAIVAVERLVDAQAVVPEREGLNSNGGC